MASPDPSRKRTGATIHGPVHRAKRGRYSKAACLRCKQKKLKCVKNEDDQACQSCENIGFPCILAPRSGNRSTALKKTRVMKENFKVFRSDLVSLAQHVASVQEQVTSLSMALSDLTEHLNNMTDSPIGESFQLELGAAEKGPPSTHCPEPRQSQFFGPMRSAYSLKIAKASLSQMSFNSDDISPVAIPFESPSSAMETVDGSSYTPGSDGADVLLSLDVSELCRLLEVYEEEVQSEFPFIDMKKYSGRIDHILNHVRSGPVKPGARPGRTPIIQPKYAQIVKVAAATSLVIEAQGPIELSRRLIDDVEPGVSRVSGEAVTDLEEIQISTMLSIYWFHSGEELLAWRSIAMSAREIFEIGLHKRSVLFKNFSDFRERELALRAFWCVYVLDRQFSFGTGLSFAIPDREIDPQLPEPGDEHPYLRCVVAYSRLCSQVRDSLPTDLSSNSIPERTLEFLELAAQNWINSIPEDLQLRHPRRGFAPWNRPHLTRRMRTLLHLRGNYIRMLIHKQHVLSAMSAGADIQGARLVFALAQDTIQVLVHLNNAGDIYIRQQLSFNYFLLDALASITLAVSHAPHLFAEPCKETFQDAIRLVQVLSQKGPASERLWQSIRALVCQVSSLEPPKQSELAPAPLAILREGTSHQPIVPGDTETVYPAQDNFPGQPNDWGRIWADGSDHSSYVADMLGIGTEVLELVGAFK